MNVEIILATATDAEALAVIQKKAFKRLYEIYQDEGSPYLRGADEIIRWFEHPTVHVYVYKIMADGILCGGVAFYERNNMPGVYYLARIYILPEMQSKGIASKAILLCEETVANATLWTLDYPVNEAANRRCYEKAGYKDTGERREQSNGAITLAFMEKKIPALSITETDKERQARIYPIVLSEYNPAWTEWFTEEKTTLERLIGKDNIARISHYGSTSVPGLAAKPTVDILLEIAESVDIEELIALMPKEYICLRREGNSLSEHDRVMIIKGYTDTGFADKVFHIHVRNPGDWDELYFRDFLIAHPETAAEYAALKYRLFKDYEHNRDGYTNAKGEFIKDITKKAREEKNDA